MLKRLVLYIYILLSFELAVHWDVRFQVGQLPESSKSQFSFLNHTIGQHCMQINIR